MATSPVPRTIGPVLQRLFTRYPTVTLTGPRQSGKTTLCRTVFPGLPYLNLEAPDVRDFALQDPRGFLGRHRDGAIIDEIQRAPELLSYIQVLVDEQKQNGLFVLTGSQQLGINASVSQSLAGRTGLLRLLPFSMEEAGRLRPGLDLDAYLHRGFYPRIYDQDLPPREALGDYYETYVERDVRPLSAIRDLSAFRRFIKLCAGRVGQLLNLQSLGNDCGVSHTTARGWMSVLEAGYVVFLLTQYHANVSKRLMKSPKLYFYDVGLVSYLLGIEHEEQVFTHPLRGNLFENMVVMEALKQRYNSGLRDNLSFYRESRGHEVDLLSEVADGLLAVEIKAGATVARGFFDGLRRLDQVLPGRVRARALVYGGDEEYERDGVLVTSPSRLAGWLESHQG
jgi:predicted AAA+ superfamily ATPase